MTGFGLGGETKWAINLYSLTRWSDQVCPSRVTTVSGATRTIAQTVRPVFNPPFFLIKWAKGG